MYYNSHIQIFIRNPVNMSKNQHYPLFEEYWYNAYVFWLIFQEESEFYGFRIARSFQRSYTHQLRHRVIFTALHVAHVYRPAFQGEYEYLIPPWEIAELSPRPGFGTMTLGATNSLYTRSYSPSSLSVMYLHDNICIDS